MPATPHVYNTLTHRKPSQDRILTRHPFKDPPSRPLSPARSPPSPFRLRPISRSPLGLADACASLPVIASAPVSTQPPPTSPSFSLTAPAARSDSGQRESRRQGSEAAAATFRTRPASSQATRPKRSAANPAPSIDRPAAVADRRQRPARAHKRLASPAVADAERGRTTPCAGSVEGSACDRLLSCRQSPPRGDDVGAWSLALCLLARWPAGGDDAARAGRQPSSSAIISDSDWFDPGRS
jgi:hypothetical protein